MKEVNLTWTKLHFYRGGY